jgi:phosphatidylserine synthase
MGHAALPPAAPAVWTIWSIDSRGSWHKEVDAVEWDLGFGGLAVLAGMSLAFGLIAQVALWSRTTRWLWLIAAATYFVSGLFVSEVMFGWATAADLQPNIDGLSFDEVLLISLVPGIVAVFATWYATRSQAHHRPMSP